MHERLRSPAIASHMLGRHRADIATVGDPRGIECRALPALAGSHPVAVLDDPLPANEFQAPGTISAVDGNDAHEEGVHAANVRAPSS